MRARVFIGLLPLLASLLGVGLTAGAASAQPAQPLDRLLPEIRRNVPGQFLDAESANQNGNPRYHLKWLTPDGRVMWLDADARTGRVMGRAPGRDTFDAPRPRGDENGGPPDRGGEGRSNTQRYDRGGDDSRFERRQFRPADNGDDGRPPQRNFDNGGERGQGGFGRFDRFDRGGAGGDRGFGGRPDFGNRGDRGGQGGDRGFGGGRDRRGNNR